jgi:phosphoglycerol transferase
MGAGRTSPDLQTSRSSVKGIFAEVIGVLVSAVASFWFLTSRIEGVLVSVLNDEYTYLVDTMPDGESKTGLPNYLFRFVYAYTLNCGDDFYSCARSLNAVFVIGSAVFIYLLARHLSGKIWVAAISGASAILGSLGTYTAYFMPEAIFNFFMLAFFWALTRFGSSNHLLIWAGIGAVAGIASLAKPHAFFVMPAVAIFVFLWTRATSNRYLLRAFARIVTAGASMLIVKFANGFLLVGEAGVTVFGAYGGAISTPEAVSTTLGVNTWMNVPASAWGQILMTTMIIGLSLTISLPSIWNVFRKDQSTFTDNKFRVLFGLSLLNMMAVSAVFEAWQNIPYWMHTRYHSYLIPLGIVAIAEAYRRWDVKSDRKVKIGAVALLVVLSIIALATAGVPYGANWIDAPDFKAHIDTTGWSSASLIAAAGLAIWWIWNPKWSMRVALVFTLISSILVGMFVTNFLKESFGNETTYDQLGKALKISLTSEQLDKAVLVGDNWVNLDRALFTAINSGATKIQAADGRFSLEGLDPRFEWLVRVGEVEIEGLSEPVFSGANYSLHPLSTSASQPPLSNQPRSATNSCKAPEDKGWVCGNTTTLELAEPLPINARVDLIVKLDERLAGTELEITVGDSSFVGVLPGGTDVFTLRFSNSVEVTEIRISHAGENQDKQARFLRVVSLASTD